MTTAEGKRELCIHCRRNFANPGAIWCRSCFDVIDHGECSKSPCIHERTRPEQPPAPDAAPPLSSELGNLKTARDVAYRIFAEMTVIPADAQEAKVIALISQAVAQARVDAQEALVAASNLFRKLSHSTGLRCCSNYNSTEWEGHDPNCAWRMVVDVLKAERDGAHRQGAAT